MCPGIFTFVQEKLACSVILDKVGIDEIGDSIKLFQIGIEKVQKFRLQIIKVISKNGFQAMSGPCAIRVSELPDKKITNY